ncbi:hypothetical protein HHI36_022029, partial [Cryptolaemus montrouzieri]
SYTGNTFEPHLSDHRAQVLELSKGNVKIKTFREKYDTKRKNIDKFISDVRTINWTEVISESDAGKAYEKFHSAIHTSFNKSFLSRVSEASLGQIKTVEAANTIYRVRRDDNSVELLSVLKKHLRNSYTDTRKKENAEYILDSTDKSRA